MPNPFDGLQDNLFDKIKEVFGYDASWSPSSGGGLQETRVLFREPNEKELMLRPEFNPKAYYCEFRQGDDFGIALYDAVRTGLDEVIYIEGREFYVREVFAAHDGRTFKAYLEEI